MANLLAMSVISLGLASYALSQSHFSFLPLPLTLGAESQGLVVEIFPYEMVRPFKNKLTSSVAFTLADVLCFYRRSNVVSSAVVV